MIGALRTSQKNLDFIMNKQIIPVDTTRSIVVIDDTFLFSEISTIYSHALNQNYQIYNSNDLELQNISNKRMGCKLDIESEILDIVFTENSLDKIEEFIPTDKFYPERAYINLGLHSDVHKIHVDDAKPGGSKTLLLYMNRDWDCNWGGETIFYDDQRKNILYTSPFIPGRIVIFDGSIPHSAKPQHLSAVPYRFTLAVKFKASK